MNLLQRVIKSLLFFHPVVWLISRRMSAEREACCDDLVVSSGHERMRYADALLRMAELCSLARHPDLAALAASGRTVTQFERRIRRLISANQQPRLCLTRAGILASLALLVLLVASPMAVQHYLVLAQEAQTADEDNEDGPANAAPVLPEFGEESHGLQARFVALRQDDGDGETSTTRVSGQQGPENTASATPAAQRLGTLTGRFVFDGEPPKPEKLVIPTRRRTLDDREFDWPEGIRYSQLGLTDQSLLVNNEGGIQNVLVWIRSKDVPIPPQAAADGKAILRAKDGQFTPRVLAFQTPRPLVLKNEEANFVTMQWETHLGEPFNRLVPEKSAIEFTIEKSDRMPEPLTCNVFPWMKAFLFPCAHPYFAVSAADGTFRIDNLPPGEWEFQVWHERTGYVNTDRWPRGRFTLEIQGGGNDLGIVKVAPELFTSIDHVQTAQKQPTGGEVEPVTLLCVDENNQPVVGAEVHLFQHNGGEPAQYVKFGPFKSDEQGKLVCEKALFSREGSNYDRWIYARVPGRLVGAARSVKFLNNKTFNVEGRVRLFPSHSVEGTVKVPDGFDPSSLTVRVQNLHVITGTEFFDYESWPRHDQFPGLDTALPEIFDRRPDAEGRVRFDDIPTSGRLYLVTSGKGLGEAQWRNEGNTIDGPFQIVVEKEGVVKGRVLTPSGEPAAKVNVSARLSSGGRINMTFLSTFRAVTDDDGRFSIAGVPQTEFTLSVEDPRQRWTFRPLEDRLVLSGQSLDVDLTTEKPVTVSGRVLDPDDNPGEGARKFPGVSDAERGQHPVQQVSWYDAVMFCNWISAKHGLQPCYTIAADPKRRGEYKVEQISGANGFRLPTDREWEYACRAMTSTEYAFGDTGEALKEYGIYEANSQSRTGRVASRLCNGWGLFDMHGNVWEWCWDRYSAGSYRVYRGGGWLSPSRYCRSSLRVNSAPPARSDYVGFRLAAVPSESSQ